MRGAHQLYSILCVCLFTVAANFCSQSPKINARRFIHVIGGRRRRLHSCRLRSLTTGCACSSEEEPPGRGRLADVATQGEPEAGETKIEVTKQKLIVQEAVAVKAKPGDHTFIASVLKARADAAEDANVMFDCCLRLQAFNQRLKSYVAVYDCETVHEAMNGGFMGLGCNDRKLIACLLTRTKAQLERTRHKYRELYDKDLAPRLVFSGGPTAGEKHETEVMRDLAIELGRAAVEADGNAARLTALC